MSDRKDRSHWQTIRAMMIKCHESIGAESILGERSKRAVATISTVWLIIALGRVVYQLAPAYFHPQGSHFTAPVWGPWDLLLLTPLIVIGVILAGISLWAELGGGTFDADELSSPQPPTRYRHRHTQVMCPNYTATY